jgi:UDP-2-acetamido-2-deoxy-ribo-hexuluronate aminotransferase
VERNAVNFIELQAQYQSLKADIDAGIQRVLDHGHYIMGPEVRQMEQVLEAYTGARHCIAVASGTDALLMALMAAGIGQGHEVITTAFSFAGTAETIVLAGAKPVFVDIEADTCNIDVSKIEAKITPVTRAIMPVSLYGQASDMDEINALAAKHGLLVIEDAAQSFGADYRGRKSCNVSGIACTSFFPSKPLGCYGDGGAIFTDDDELAMIMRQIRVHGDASRYEHVRLGINGRLDSIQCAVILAKMPKFPWEVERRIAIGARYNDAFANVVPVVQQRGDRTSVYAQYTIMVENRDVFRKRLSDEGVPTAVHYPLAINEQPYYGQFCCPDCTPVASAAAKRVVSLPMSAYLSEADQDRVIEVVKKAVR